MSRPGYYDDAVALLGCAAGEQVDDFSSWIACGVMV